MVSSSGVRAYRSVRRLARGGMGQVEIVVRREGHFQRVYALKRLHGHYANDPQARAMFIDEARIAGLIRHANAVSVLDVGEDEQGPFLVMDYVDGPSVSRLCAAAEDRGMRLPVEVALEIARQAALGLHAAHELRSPEGVPLDVVHRDVSPQNLLVGFDGTVRVTDFGVARALDRFAQTDVGGLKGKVGYMSPEQLRFAPLDRRSDVFALGAVLFEMLAARRLYSGDPVTVFRRVLEEPPPSVRALRPEVSEDVDALLRAMLAKDPAARPATAREVAARIDRALTGSVDLARFLEERFPDEHERQRAFVSEALSSGEMAVFEDATELDPVPPVHAPRRRNAAAMIAGSIVLAGGAIALIAALALPAEEDARAAPAEPPAVAVQPLASEPPRAAEEPAAERPPVPEPPPVVAPAPGPEPAAHLRPRPRADRARPRRREDAPPPSRPAPSVPSWEWD